MFRKIYFILIFSFLFCGSLFGQNRDAVWMLGYQYGPTKPAIDFTSGIADTFSLVRPMDLLLSGKNKGFPFFTAVPRTSFYPIDQRDSILKKIDDLFYE